MADRAPIDAKIETLRRCVARIESKQPFDVNRLSTDWDLQDIVSINLERLVQTSVDIAAMLLADAEAAAPQTMAESFTGLRDVGVIDGELCKRLRGAVGLRNILVHAYTSIDWQVVHHVVSHQLEDVKALGRAVDAFLARA